MLTFLTAALFRRERDHSGFVTKFHLFGGEVVQLYCQVLSLQQADFTVS